MTTGKAQTIVLLSGLVTFGFAFISSFTKTNRTAHGEFPAPYHVRLFVGGAIVYTTLSALAEFQPSIAAPFAVTIGTTVMFTTGGPVLEQLMALGGPAPKPTTVTPGD